MGHPSGETDGGLGSGSPSTVTGPPVGVPATGTLSPGSLLEHAPFGVLVADVGGALLWWNTAAAELLGLGADDLGSPVRSLWRGPESAEGSRGLAEAALRDGAAAPHVVRLRDGRVLEVTSVPTRLEDDRPAVLVLTNDITERMSALDSRDRLRDQVLLLSEVTDALADARDGVDAMDRLGRLVVPRMADWATLNTYDDAGRTVRVAVVHSDPSFAELADVVGRRMPGAMSERTPSRRLARGEPAMLIPHVTAEVLHAFVDDETVVQMLLDLDAHSGMAVPMPGAGRVMGSMVLVNRAASPTFTEEDLAVATELARRCGLALERVALAAEQRELATALQASMLTEPPTVPGAEIEVRYEAAAHAAQVGGDWYDAFVQPCGSVVLSIGDVSGHDPQAAATMGQIRALMRGIAFGTDAGPAELLGHLDTTLDALAMSTTATAVVARLLPVEEPGERVLEWSNAGHLPPVLVPPKRGGERQPARVLDTPPNLLLGLSTDAEREVHRLVLEPGAVLILYTDGLVERRREGIDTGVGRLLAAVDALAIGDDLSLGDLCDRLLGKLMPGQGLDDVALLAVRLRG